ncbi:BatD family protein [Chitinivibrio alkaliphilus]|uniref:Protein BatD n=1 Tax=Chitinivibrio alkaliphilus ACht1 TaxID=1313304 RepID=U7DCX9_9BACT|nr:BatD family protein [Chitinivibrio alkaliphilus]ERP38751.1 hypothetical protein CALK_0770 [Chitinivibrio alkaliphilus ACht1]
MKPVLLLLLCVLSMAAGTIELTTEQTSLSVGDIALVRADINLPSSMDTPPHFEEHSAYTATLENVRHGTSRQVAISGGRQRAVTTVQYSLLYQVTFHETGEITLPPLRFTHNEKEYVSNEITFQIDDTPQDSQAPEELFVEIRPDKHTLYTGETMGITVHITWPEKQDVQLSNQDLHTLLDTFRDAFPEDHTVHIVLQESLRDKRKIRNGVPHRTLEIPFEVTPLSAGDFSIPALEFSYYERRMVRSDDRRRHGLFGSMHRAQNVRRHSRTTPQHFSVQDPPRPPENFTGAMNRVRLSASLPDTVVTHGIAAGASTDLTVTLRGKVPKNVLRSYTLPDIPGVTTFAPEREMRQDTLNGRTYSRADYTFVLIPEEEGSVTIPELSFTWFHTDRKEYIHETTAPMEFTVLPGRSRSSERVRTQRGIRENKESISSIRTTPGTYTLLSPQHIRRHIRPLVLLWGLVFLLILLRLFFALPLWKHPTRKKQHGYFQTIRQLRACARGKECSSPTAITEKYLASAAGFSTGVLSRPELEKALIQRGVSSEGIRSIYSLLDTIEMDRYARQKAPSEESLKDLCVQIKKIERELCP